MLTETALLQEIVAHPHEEDLWLVFADWLEDRGDPRGELVRLRHGLTRSIEVEGRAGKESRLQELLAAGVEPITPTRTNSIGMKLSLIPPGKFLMGSPASEKNRMEWEDQVAVTLTRAFYLGETEVTQAQWKAVMGAEPWRDDDDDFQEGPEYPATYVSWDDAVAFCRNLTKQEHSAGRLAQGWRYALPTEAQWEYACRAGTTTAYSFGDDPALLGDYAWFIENAWDLGEEYAHEVRLKKPNAWNLYDMHGNACEWCADYWHHREIPNLSPQSDPTGPTEDLGRVLRSGCGYKEAHYCRSSFRDGTLPTDRGDSLTFRLAAIPTE
ncbi:SUMF1/EgtB/PvdO family nonheme iron enzyme [Lignipirellula cremea]|uniref:Formylglycine-generating sulfatase enzyme n=1 Tax=Lignipirellula cremea TaxID=2528010 RepID=A0A518E0P4_9BACT|nr:SUMF1/EgtB/PvdO family nonheme iron enzyme [Lignipirellula cremea]QDU97664.1 Formylglycine-generating sulfatase enzyme [Lignipirellula cremea]